MIILLNFAHHQNLRFNLSGSALEDLCLDDFDISNIDKELEKDNDSTSVSSSLSAGLSASGTVVYPMEFMFAVDDKFGHRFHITIVAM